MRLLALSAEGMYANREDERVRRCGCGIYAPGDQVGYQEAEREAVAICGSGSMIWRDGYGHLSDPDLRERAFPLSTVGNSRHYKESIFLNMPQFEQLPKLWSTPGRDLLHLHGTIVAPLPILSLPLYAAHRTSFYSPVIERAIAIQ